MKKILFVSHTANFSKFNRSFMKWFREQGWNVYYASDGEEPILDCDYSYKICFSRSPFNLNNIKAYHRLKNIIEKEKFDIIHCHTPVGGAIARLAARKARKYGTKVIYTGHGFHFYKGAPVLNWLLYYPAEKFCAKYTDCLITINEEDYNNVKHFQFQAGMMKRVHGVGVPLERFYCHTLEEKQLLRKQYRYKKDAFILICVAEINKNKNQRFLIEAVRKLYKRHPEIKLLLVGKGPVQGELEQRVKEENIGDIVQFLGYRSDVENLIALSDILVTASYREGLPVNIMEAMASGLPVVCTDVRGQRELIINEKNGYLYPIDDEEEFCKKIELLTEKTQREIMGKNNIKDVKKYAAESVLEEMKKIYETYMR